MSGGFNVSRRIVGGYTLNNTYDERRLQSSKGSPPPFQSAVVIDVICDLSLLTDEVKNEIKNSVNNYELLEVMPVNAVIAQLINDDLGNAGTNRTILFPFFSSHIMMPVSPGEIVHVVYQDLIGKGMKVGYWISRIHGNRSVEDANYTHLDRQFDPNNNLGNWSTADLRNVTSETYTATFPNGGNTITTYDLTPRQPGENPYDEIVERAIASNLRRSEVVPRWNKRPGEFILQGSNNSIIILGDDREGPAEPQEGDARDYSGKIDIVAGRGRYLPQSPTEDPDGTAPRVVENARGALETDKAPFRGADKTTGARKKDNPREGDPDYINDAARLLIAMRVNGDERLGVLEQEFPENIIPIEQPEESETYNRAYAAAKADHIRLLARRDEERGIKGTILFMREGDEESGEDPKFIYINEHGIQFDAEKIYLGRAVMKDPSEATDDDFNSENGKYEPYILWSKYKDTVDNLQDQINELKEKHESAMKALREEVSGLFSDIAIALSANVSVPYSSNPAITAMQAQINARVANLSLAGTSDFESVNNKLKKMQDDNGNNNVSRKNHSQKIYGE